MTPLRMLALIWALAAGAAVAQTGPGGSGSHGYRALDPLHGGETITAIVVEVEPPDAPGAEALKARVRDKLDLAPGDLWDPMLGAAVRVRLEALHGIRAVEFAGRVVGGGVGREPIVKVRPAAAEALEPARGMLVKGDLADFPARYPRGGRYLQVVLNRGFGVYSDGNPWFDSPATFTRGNPLVEQPAKGAAPVSGPAGPRGMSTSGSAASARSPVRTSTDSGPSPRSLPPR